MLFEFNSQKWVDFLKTEVNNPQWSRDSRYLYFINVPGTQFGIYRIGIFDRKLEQIVDLKKLGRVAWGTWWTWFGLTPDGSPLVLRDVGSQEVYALDWEAP